MRRRTVRILGGAAACGFLALNVLAWNHARAMTHFTKSGTRTRSPERLGSLAKARVLLAGVRVPRPESRRTPAALGLPFSAVRIPGDEGIALGAWQIPGDAPRAAVALFHGYATEKSSLLEEARLYHRLGCAVLLVDLRGAGDSSGSATTLGCREAADVAAACRYARARWPALPLVVHGQSMGAVAALRAVAVDGVRPDAMVIESVFDTLLQTVRNRFHAMRVPSFPNAELLVFWGGVQGGFNGFAHNPVDYARAVQCPVLFLHGEKDPRATAQQAHRVFDAVSGPRAFHVFEGAGHESCAAADAAAWTAAVAGFLEDTRLP